ncbi:MAG: glucose 1-dehydrogenase [Treponemataceae bacterium]
MHIGFEGKVVLITGASTGLGAAMADAFGSLGAKVVIHYNISETSAKDVAARIGKSGAATMVVQADVTKQEDVDRLVKTVTDEWGRIDVLINNAGGLLRRASVEEMTDEDFYRVVDLNITSTFRMCRAVVPLMKRQGGGNIINFSSVAARNGGASGAVLYASTKAFVSTFTHGLSKEVAAYEIRVNAIAPGVIDTPFHEKYTSPELMKTMAGGIALKRLGTADEISGTAIYLASDALSSFTTGEVIDVNGGAWFA